MIYSVEKPDHSGFKYYEGNGAFPPIGAFRTPRGTPINGLFPPAQYLPLLPSGVKPAGEGKEARGIVSVLPAGVLEGLPEPVKRWGPPLIVGVILGRLWQAWRKK